MAASSFVNVCRFNPTAGGTTDWTYSSAVTGYQSPSAAGVVNGAQYSYRAESSDLSQWEIGQGAYNTSTGVLARTTVLSNSSGTTSKINFSAAPEVAIVALSQDMVPQERGQLPGTTTNDSASAGNIGEYGSTTTNVTPGVTFSVSGTPYNIASTSLAAGDYDVWGSAVYVPGGATTATQMLCWISTTSASNPGTDSGDVTGFGFGAGITGGAASYLNVVTKRISLSSTTTVYLGGQCSFTSTAPVFGGTLKWRRVR